MLGIIYLLLCFLTGYGIIELLFKDFGSTAHKTFSGKDTNLSSAFILLPAYFITGVLVMTCLYTRQPFVTKKHNSPLCCSMSLIRSQDPLTLTSF